MAENKTTQNDLSVQAFLDRAAGEKRRQDCDTILKMMQKATGEEPKMWGDAIVGFGSQHYKYESGREGDMPIIGFSPRKQTLTLYIAMDFDGFSDLLGRLGKAKTSVVCLYIKRLADVDLGVLEEMIERSLKK
jgi:hypothetical protein